MKARTQIAVILAVTLAIVLASALRVSNELRTYRGIADRMLVVSELITEISHIQSSFSGLAVTGSEYRARNLSIAMGKVEGIKEVAAQHGWHEMASHASASLEALDRLRLDVSDNVSNSVFDLYMTQVNLNMTRLVSDATDLINYLSAEKRERWNAFVKLFFGLVSVLVVACLSQALLFYRSGVRPVLAATQFAGEVSRGNFRKKIDVRSNTSEIQELVASLRAMASSLEERARDIEHACRIAALGRWRINPSSREMRWSAEISEMFGADADSFEPSVSNAAALVHPEDRENFVARLVEGMAAGGDYDIEFRVLRADGSVRHLCAQGTSANAGDPHDTWLPGICQDVTERREMELRSQQAQKMEAVGQLTGGVAHDFNNLLTVIVGTAEALENELSAVPHLQKLAKMSLDAAERGADLTNRLLAFSRKQTLDPKVLDVAQLIQGIDGLLRRTFPENIDFEIVRSGGLWKIEADAAQLESALLNLAVNARDAMPEGGKLTIEMANAMLDDDYVAIEKDVRPGQYVVIIVTDTGTGMPPNVLARVFEPFFSTKEVGKGSGLGLSMVFGFVKQSGGHIRIYSELDEGTAIKMYFPRTQTEQENVVIVGSGRKIAGGTETILVVEDDGDVREYVTAQLQRLGYNVLQASTGSEAMETLNLTPEIDLLFTDVVMPGGMSGRELADAARNLRPSLNVLFTSGYTENSIVHQGRLDPGVMLLNKPYRREQLAAKVREVLDEHGE